MDRLARTGRFAQLSVAENAGYQQFSCLAEQKCGLMAKIGVGCLFC